MINLIEENLNRGHTPEGLYSKEDTASPTVSQDSFFLTAIRDVAEERDVTITDIKRAYVIAIFLS
jgi:hypothetical protein